MNENVNEAGIYDDLCTYARENAKAESTLLIVINGNKGSGFSIQSTNKAHLASIPDVLESMAKQIRMQMHKATFEQELANDTLN